MNVPFSQRQAAIAVSISAFLVLIVLAMIVQGLANPASGSPAPTASSSPSAAVVSGVGAR